MDILNIIGREKELFLDDLKDLNPSLMNIIKSSKFLVVGGLVRLDRAYYVRSLKENQSYCML